MIVRPVQLIRVGASFQMPTYYHLTDEKFTDINAYWDNASGYADASSSSPNGIYDYKLTTPWRANVHASVILFKKATVSAGYEYVDYSASRLDATDYKFYDENDRIRNDFQAVHNIKAGAEYRLNSLYFRAGTQYLMSPFTDNRNDAEEWIYSAGVGFRSKTAYLDISYTHSGRSEVYGLYAYEPGLNEVSVNQINANNLMVTLGLKF
jgi:long-subunit fatty acid transport protein